MKKQNVMIVDDDSGIQRAARLILMQNGYNVVQAFDGHECLAALRKGFNGVILMDIMMPDLSGWQTIKAIRDEGLLGQSLICMLTAMTGPGEETTGMEELVFDYLAKPFGHPQLLSMVANAADMIAE